MLSHRRQATSDCNPPHWERPIVAAASPVTGIHHRLRLPSRPPGTTDTTHTSGVMFLCSLSTAITLQFMSAQGAAATVGWVCIAEKRPCRRADLRSDGHQLSSGVMLAYTDQKDTMELSGHDSISHSPHTRIVCHKFRKLSSNLSRDHAIDTYLYISCIMPIYPVQRQAVPPTDMLPSLDIQGIRAVRKLSIACPEYA